MNVSSGKVKLYILFTKSSKRFALYSLVDLFNLISSRLLWETFRYGEITARRLFLHPYLPPSTANAYSFAVRGELEQCRVNELARG